MMMLRATFSAAIIILSTINDFKVLAYDFNHICNGAEVRDSSPLETASERALDNVVSRAESSPANVVDFCEDGTDDSGDYTMHGQGGCSAADGCDDCVAQAQTYLWSNCHNRLGGQAHEEENGYCFIRFENYRICQSIPTHS